MAPLLGLGIGFLTDLVGKYGEDLVVAGVEKVTGVDLKKDELTSEDKKAIMAGELALKELDFKKLELELESIKEANRHQESAVTAQVDEYSNSRNLQVEALRQEDKFSKRFIYYFAMFWSAFSVVYLACITFIQIPSANIRFADTIVGFLLGTIIATIIGFFYGNSIKKDNK